jgi:16S rRNA (cytosine967-C5)-methyltransferase
LLQNYPVGEIPFHTYLQNEFRKNPNFGSKDRRLYRELTYTWLRTGEHFSKAKAENLAIAYYLKNNENTICKEWLMDYFPTLKSNFTNTELIAISGFSQPKLYEKFINEIEIDVTTLNSWFQSPPPLWIRAFPGQETNLEKFLSNAEFAFQKNGLAYQLPPNKSVESAVNSGFARVQDLGSQMVFDGLAFKNGDTVWDCCCGAGGKSLLIKERYGKINLFCSDVRPQILANLKTRFNLAGFSVPKLAEANLENATSEFAFENETIPHNFFDTIVADVPCSGSGTWRHNPENIQSPLSIEKYVAKQQKIVSRAIQYLKPGGSLIYLTCSVFQQENTLNTLWMENNLPLTKISNQYIGGADLNADYLFLAVFKKNEK